MCVEISYFYLWNTGLIMSFSNLHKANTFLHLNLLDKTLVFVLQVFEAGCKPVLLIMLHGVNNSRINKFETKKPNSCGGKKMKLLVTRSRFELVLANIQKELAQIKGFRNLDQKFSNEEN